jgi:hypothetical protein
MTKCLGSLGVKDGPRREELFLNGMTCQGCLWVRESLISSKYLERYLYLQSRFRFREPKSGPKGSKQLNGIWAEGEAELGWELQAFLFSVKNVMTATPIFFITTFFRERILCCPYPPKGPLFNPISPQCTMPKNHTSIYKYIRRAYVKAPVCIRT